MSPRKLTEDDKQEILNLYRNSEATTSTLANDYEVSSSTISRFLKNKLSSIEYEDLIQQKRLARTPRGEKMAEVTTVTSKKVATTKKAKAKSSSKNVSAKDKEKITKTKSAKTKSAKTKTTRKKKEKALANIEPPDTTQEIPIQLEIETPLAGKSEPKTTRRRRRRSSSVEEITTLEASEDIAAVEEPEVLAEATEEKSPNKLVIDRQPGGNSNLIADSLEESDFSKVNSLILKTDRVDMDEDEEEEENSEVDLVTIKEMLGDDLEDFNDEDDDEDDDWDDDTEEDGDFMTQGSALHDIEILPLSQASMPRICYLVIDRSAELIVKPLADFADLGDIPQEEIKQRTLPIFDNHRIAKRFSHRRERVIKVPDGQMIQKTSHHLENKGITRLLIDGQIYSLAY